MPYSAEYMLQLLQCSLKHPCKTKQIHSLLITHGHLHSSLKSNDPPSLKWMPTLFYNTLIRAYLINGQSHKTLGLFTHMLASQAPPNSYTFPSLIKAASSLPCVEMGKTLHSQAIKRGVLCDPFVQTTFVVLYAEQCDLFDACKVFEEMTQLCIVANNAMLHAFCKNGDIGSAISLFEQMPKKDIVSWTTVINGFGRIGYFDEAIRFFKKMIAHESVMNCPVKPNAATYVSILSLCASLDGRGALDSGKQLHGYIIRNEVKLAVFVGTALIDFYGKMGYLKSATNVFNKMLSKEVCSWNAMISALASNGKEKEAVDMIEKMKAEGLQPNGVTFVAVLTACARQKFVSLGLELFQSMLCDFKIIPSMEHYGCVIDLLGRAGFLREATDIIRNMPFQPDGSVLGSLLGACKIHEDVELADEIGTRVLELQPQHSGWYALLSSINAGIERWDRTANMRKIMVETGIQKIPAYSLISFV